MKRLMLLLESVLYDCSAQCGTSTARDLTTITSRVEYQGHAFLTITLPAFCSEFERALDVGFVEEGSFLGWRKAGKLPVFLGELLDLIFDRRTAILLDVPDVSAIFYIRQLCLMWKKVRIECSEERKKRAFQRYVECEKDLATWEKEISRNDLSRFARVSSLLWASTLAPVDRLVHEGMLVPKHGPGATADRLVGNSKYEQTSWPMRLEDSGFFGSDEFLLANAGWAAELACVEFLEPGVELPVRVIAVPKTLKTPRIIAIEPTAMQYAQQSLMAVLVDALEGSSFLSGSVGFTDQGPNQDLARVGSIDGSLATIDLSDASDRVSNLLVKTLFGPHKALSGALQASRSVRADVPGYGILEPLVKFASMGSATCFPVEAMVFLTIVVLGYEKWLGKTASQRQIKALLRRVRIYGDDIICPVEIVPFVVSELGVFACRVNVRKSFWTGKFRESCGRDYYDGHDVTVGYVRDFIPAQRSEVEAIVSTVALRNHLYKGGLWNAAQMLDLMIEEVAPFPVVGEKSPVLGRHSFLGYKAEKMCPNLHRPIVKGLVVKTVTRKSPLDGHGALLKYLLAPSRHGWLDRLYPVVSKDHLLRYGRPESFTLKLRWAVAH